MKTDILPIEKVKVNDGEVDGLPKNPRFIKDDRYKALLKSIKEDPEMLELRELIVYPVGDKYITIAGNMRLKVMQELGMKEAPVKILPPETPVEKLRAYTIKDNVPFGEWDFDVLGNEFEVSELEDWGLDISELKVPDFEPVPEDEQPRLDEKKKTVCPECGHEFTA